MNPTIISIKHVPYLFVMIHDYIGQKKVKNMLEKAILNVRASHQNVNRTTKLLLTAFCCPRSFSQRKH